MLGVNVFVWPYVLKADALVVTFFDVGQGDAIFIEMPQGHQVLIDGGPDDRVLAKLGNRMPFWDRNIDLVIATHPDQDHIGGLPDVLRAYRVENILWTGIEKDTRVSRAWGKALEREKEEGAKVAFARAGQRILWSIPIPASKPTRSDLVGSVTRADLEYFMEVVWPSGALEWTARNTNDGSIVVKLVFYRNSFLFTGDITSKAEKEFVAKGMDVDADMLKVAHHGSKTSSAEAFLAAVTPGIAVMQVGKNNRYGHPHEGVLDRFERLGIPVLRTDQNGDIVVRSNGSDLSISYE